MTEFKNLRLTSEERVVLRKKHYSKNFLGYAKQYKRQRAKGEVSEVLIKPIILSYDSETNSYLPLHRVVANPWIVKTTLDWLTTKSDNQTKSYGGLYNLFELNREGKVVLSMHGKRVLRRKKENY